MAQENSSRGYKNYFKRSNVVKIHIKTTTVKNVNIFHHRRCCELGSDDIFTYLLHKNTIGKTIRWYKILSEKRLKLEMANDNVYFRPTKQEY